MVLYSGFILYISMCLVSEDGFITVAILVSFKSVASLLYSLHQSAVAESFVAGQKSAVAERSRAPAS